MSLAMLNMYISFAGIILMFVSAGTAFLARTRLNGILSKIVLSFSFICMVVAGLIVAYIVLGGPTSNFMR